MGAQNQKKWAPEGWGPKGGSPEGGGLKGGGPKVGGSKYRFFQPSPAANFRYFLLSVGSSREIVPAVQGCGPPKMPSLWVIPAKIDDSFPTLVTTVLILLRDSEYVAADTDVANRPSPLWCR